MEKKRMNKGTRITLFFYAGISITITSIILIIYGFFQMKAATNVNNIFYCEPASWKFIITIIIFYFLAITYAFFKSLRYFRVKDEINKTVEYWEEYANDSKEALFNKVRTWTEGTLEDSILGNLNKKIRIAFQNNNNRPFNQEKLLEGVKAKSSNIITFTMSVMPLIGLLGTFIGLKGAISEIDFEVESDILKQTPLILSGLKLAFITSIVGIACSASVALAYAIYKGIGQRFNEDLYNLANSYIMPYYEDENRDSPIRNNEEVVEDGLNDAVFAMNKSATTMSATADNISTASDTLKKMATTFNDNLDEMKEVNITTQESIAKVANLEGEMKLLTEEINKGLLELVNKMEISNASNKNINEHNKLIDMQLKEIDQGLKTNSELAKATIENLTTITGENNKVLSEILNSQLNEMERNREKTSSMFDKHEENSIIGNKQISEIMNAYVSKMDDFKLFIESITKDYSESLLKIQKENMEEFSSAINSYSPADSQDLLVDINESLSLLKNFLIKSDKIGDPNNKLLSFFIKFLGTFLSIIIAFSIIYLIFIPKPKTIIDITTTPNTANIRIDNQEFGNGMYYGNLEAGKYILHITDTNHIEEHIPITINKGDLTRLNIILKKKHLTPQRTNKNKFNNSNQSKEDPISNSNIMNDTNSLIDSNNFNSNINNGKNNVGR